LPLRGGKTPEKAKAEKGAVCDLLSSVRKKELSLYFQREKEGIQKGGIKKSISVTLYTGEKGGGGGGVPSSELPLMRGSPVGWRFAWWGK